MKIRKHWLSITAVTGLVVTSLFSTNISYANTASMDESPAWSKWLQKNAYPVKKLAPSSNDLYKDLRFLKKVLKDKRVVLLGESSHGAAEFNSSKVRLVQYLHEELDYDVIAFESGLAENHAADIHASKNTPLKTMQDAIFGVWHAEETLPLFDYLKKEKKTKDPLTLAGFDMQPMGSYPTFLKDWLTKVDPSMAEKAYQTEIKFINYYHGINTTFDQFQQEKPKMISEYQDIINFVKKHKKKLSAIYPQNSNLIQVTEYALKDRINSTEKIIEKNLLFSQYVNEGKYEEAQKYFDELSVLRDQAMANHLTWLAEKLYPNKKIIVWAHNLHIRKANTKAENPNRSPVVSMGELIPARLKKQSYVVGLYMNKGVSALNNREPAPVRYPHPSGNLESILSKSGHPNVFVDLKQKNKKWTSWMFTKRQALDWGMWDEKLVPYEQYDGILFINEVHMPKYIPYQQSKTMMQKNKKPLPVSKKDILYETSFMNR
ncbi:erythromycin esterase family protein [Thermoflavimicrobium daqui]|uniref:Erythromycin esterase n=1 Tax=Thermoflavimicrobium daqui TaxID=2137476 RepID=A0A364K9B0_9BACL|nr:erythromycin esterase family protein [Thermoflavimicrobium daqui]RAL26874.1 erythromycin esterase [Thermoflavimicrobium daqui]